ncbi:hypothetical protein Zmor_010315 [Zophobas morio]|uniref:Odorant receptor n=1 Tax=Zophobas morio TaxID=2755281 RepID=A0AA38IN80_9CUCU|nr:hypothetical protein Zmor_010315 [Zophobas morio]
MATIIENSFSLNLKALNIMGLYSYGKSSIFFKIRAYILYFVLLVLTTTLIIVKIVMEESSNNLETNLMLTYVADCTSFFFKLLPFLQNSKKIKECINFFGQKSFAPKANHEKNIADECIWVCRRNSTVYFYGVMLVILGWNFPVLFVKGRKLPLRLWLPYDPSSATVNYYFTFVYIATDSLIGGLAYHATAQLKILKYNLEHFDQHLEDKLDQSSEHIIQFHCVHNHLESCIDHHKNILWFIDEYEECFSWSIFCQFAGSVFSNNDLITAICMGPWYKYDVEIRKNLLIIMERSKRPVLITAGKVVNVTVRTFVSVLKTSYSLIAVFNNYN